MISYNRHNALKSETFIEDKYQACKYETGIFV